MAELFMSPDAWMALATLTALEIVLGVDNIIFISILTSKLPKHEQDKARIIGLALAMITRILLLFSLSLIMRLTSPIFTVLQNGISGRDIILIAGGLFLMVKSTLEIHEKLEGAEGEKTAKITASFTGILIQIMFLDIVFSLDSVITAIGMAESVAVMVTAVVLAVIFMMISSGSVSRFVENHPTVKVLALSFLLLIGVALIADGLDFHIPKGYIYFSMAFSVFIEMLNMKLRKKAEPVHLRSPYGHGEEAKD